MNNKRGRVRGWREGERKAYSPPPSSQVERGKTGKMERASGQGRKERERCQRPKQHLSLSGFALFPLLVSLAVPSSKMQPASSSSFLFKSSFLFFSPSPQRRKGGKEKQAFPFCLYFPAACLPSCLLATPQLNSPLPEGTCRKEEGKGSSRK